MLPQQRSMARWKFALLVFSPGVLLFWVLSLNAVSSDQEPRASSASPGVIWTLERQA